MSAICLVHNISGKAVSSSTVTHIQNRTPTRGHCFNICHGDIGFGVQSIARSEDFRITENPNFQFAHCGCIENRIELSGALGISPMSSDREIIEHSIAKWHLEALSKIKGKLALLGYFFDEKCIIAYRDPLFSPALSYSFGDNDIVFATDNISHFIGNRLDKAIDRQWIVNYFASGLGQSANRTPFEHVKQVMPGEILQFKNGSIRRSRQALQFGLRKVRFSDHRDYSRALVDKLNKSIEINISGRDKIGIMLSSGLDSGLTAALAKSVTAVNLPKLKAYSWSLSGFSDADESSYIQSVTDYLGLDSRLASGLEYYPFKDFEQWPSDPSTPRANPYRRIKNLLVRIASEENCNTLLNPVFADQIYPWPRFELQDLYQDRLFSPLVAELKHIIHHQDKKLFSTPQFRQLVRFFLGKESRLTQPPKWINRSVRDLFSPKECWPAEQRKHPKPEELQRVFSLSQSGSLSYDNYYANGYGVEVCDPFYNYELCEFLSSIPAYMLHFGDNRKILARDALKGIFPESERNRSRVGVLNDFFFYGFEKNKAQLREYLFSCNNSWREFIDENYVRSFFESDSLNPKKGYLVWQCLGYENWLKNLGSTRDR